MQGVCGKMKNEKKLKEIVGRWKELVIEFNGNKNKNQDWVKWMHNRQKKIIEEISAVGVDILLKEIPKDEWEKYKSYLLSDEYSKFLVDVK